MIDFTTKILGIKGYRCIKYKEEGGKIQVYLSPLRKTGECRICKRRSKRIHEIRKKKIKHLRIRGKVVYLYIKVRRFKCIVYKRTFTERVKFLEESRERSSRQYKREVIRELVRLSFRYVSLKYKISFPTLIRWLRKTKERVDVDFSKEDKEGRRIILGIDEVSFNRRSFLTTIGNITARRLKAVLKSTNKLEVVRALKKIEEQVGELIEDVVIDIFYFNLPIKLL